MHLIVLTPEKEIFSGQVKSVKVPGTGGQFEILKNHAPIVASLSEGEVRVIDTKGNKQSFVITKGFVEVMKNEVALLVQGVVTPQV
jgi:F-type H+-transporting ATPase subunit epsilon